MRKFIGILVFLFSLHFSVSFASVLQIPENTKVIEAEAFSNDPLIDEVSLPNGLEQIGNAAFAFSGVSKVNLPGSLTSIGSKAFKDCPLSYVAAVPESCGAQFCSDNGINYHAVASFPESSHPYVNNSNLSWTYETGDYITSLDVTFSSTTETESDCDFIILETLSGAQIGEYSGKELSGKTVHIAGSSFQIKLISDESARKYGFKITDIYEHTAEDLDFNIIFNKSAVDQGNKLDCTVDLTSGYTPISAVFELFKDGESTEIAQEGTAFSYTTEDFGTYFVRVTVTDAKDRTLTKTSRNITIRDSAITELLFGTQETGTAGYTYATAIMNAIQTVKSMSVSLVSNSSGNVSSPVLIEEGEADIAISNSAPALWAATTGIESASVPVCESVRCIAGGLGHDFINVMFTQKFVNKTGITTIEELVEKQQPVKLVCKKNGSLGELTAERVFGVFDIDINNPPTWLTVVKTSGSAIKDGLVDDLYDMTIDHIGAGQANTTELCLTHDMYDVQLGEETLAKLCEQGYDYITVPAGTWNKQDTEIKTVGSQQCIIVSAEMDDETAYTITKAICENKDILVAATSTFNYFDPKVAGSRAITGCELHPGAAKYYQEMGYAYQ